MTPGGGRGWFHRRRSRQNEPESTPESTRNPGVPNDVDTTTEPTAGREQLASSVTEPPTNAEPAAQPANAMSGDEPTPPAAAFDWDAATAAALNDEADRSALPEVHPLDVESGPDRLLEDLIREIVGDAAVDTASSLHPESAGTEVVQEQDEPVSPASAGVASSDAPQSSSEADHLEEPAAAPASAAEAAVAAATEPAMPAAPAPEPLATEPSEAEPVSEPPASPIVAPEPLDAPPVEQPQPTASAEPSAAPSVAEEPASSAAGTLAEPLPAPEAAALQPTTTPDVSRETSINHGGTPLAYELADETRRRIALEEAVLPKPAKTRVLTISNQKGGVGKTTTAVNLAAALARSGARVLVIDLDPQGNASTALGVDHRSEQQSVYEVLVADLALSEVIQPSTEHESLDCVPATIHLAGAEIELVSLVAREQRLRRALDAHLASMDEPYHYVFIDCPPSLGLLTINAFVAAREVLIPIQCEYYALEGLSQLLSNIELIEKHLNPELRLSTILLTMYDSRTNLAQQVAQEVRDHFPTQTLDTIIPRSVRVSEAPSYGQSVISYDFASSGSLSYREAAAEIARRGAAKAEETN